MQLVFDFFVGSMEELLVSPLRTFLNHLRLRMSLLLRTTVENTVKVCVRRNVLFMIILRSYFIINFNYEVNLSRF